jgi:hypothetical protein
LTLVVVALFAVSGCGDSDSSANGSDGGNEGPVTVETGSLSKAEFVKQADAICAESRKEFDRKFLARTKAFSQELAELDPKEQEAFGDSVASAIIDTIFVPNYEKMISEVAALGVPSEGEGQVTAFTRHVEEALAKAEKNPGATFEQLTPFDQAIKAANAYGLNGCATSLS